MKTIYANPLMDNSVSRSPLRRPPLFFPVLFVCFALSPRAQALVPPPDGGYPGANTAEGSQALFSLSSFARESSGNTALGYQALYSDTTGSRNTATGSEALRSNNADANTATGFAALYSNYDGIYNVANGWQALHKQEELIREQQTQIKALTATVQKISEKLEVNKPAPELAANSR